MFGSCSDIFVRHSPVKSVLRLDRLDSVEQSFDTEPLAGRSWGTSGIVTTYRDRWRVEGLAMATLEMILGEVYYEEQGVSLAPASHGSPAVS